MERDQIRRTLNGMVGLKFRYKGEVHKVLRYSYETTVKIVTDKSDMVFIPEDFDPSEFEEVAEAEILQSPADHRGVVLSNQNAIITKQGLEIADILKNNINEVKRNPDYVPQAEAINNTAKILIDLAKTEIELIKATRQ